MAKGGEKIRAERGTKEDKIVRTWWAPFECNLVNALHFQDQLATTSSNYEKQLSTMSDHLCELNEKLISQSDELEVLKKSGR